MRVWAQRRRDVRWNRRSAATLAAAALLVGAFLLPWRTEVSAPAVLKAEQQAVLYTPRAVRIVAMPGGVDAGLEEGRAAFVLGSPDLDFRIAQAERAVRLQQAQANAQQVNPDQASRLPVTWRAVAEAFVAEAGVARLHPGAAARFLADDGGEELRLQLASVDVGAATELEQPELSSTNGGKLAVRADANGRLIPAEAIYRAALAPDTPVSEPRSRRRGGDQAWDGWPGRLGCLLAWAAREAGREKAGEETRSRRLQEILKDWFPGGRLIGSEHEFLRISGNEMRRKPEASCKAIPPLRRDHLPHA